MLLAAGSSATLPILNALIVVPLLGAAIVALLPKNSPGLHRQVGVLASGAAGAMSVYLATQFGSRIIRCWQIPR